MAGGGGKPPTIRCECTSHFVEFYPNTGDKGRLGSIAVFRGIILEKRSGTTKKTLLFGNENGILFSYHCILLEGYYLLSCQKYGWQPAQLLHQRVLLRRVEKVLR